MSVSDVDVLPSAGHQQNNLMIQQPFDVRRTKALAAAAYAIAAMFVFVPVLELGTQLGWQMHVSALNWRTGAVGLLSGAILTPIFGLFLAVLTASLLDHRWVQRTLGVLAILGGVALLVMVLIFTLDALQLRPAVAANMKRSFDVAAVKAVLSFTVGGGTLLATAYSVFWAGRKKEEQKPAARPVRGATDSLPLLRQSR